MDFFLCIPLSDNFEITYLKSKSCGDDTLVQKLCLWTLSIVLFLSERRISSSSDNFYLDSSLVQRLLLVELLMFFLSSRRWFVLC
jgi:hypothetical protein